MSGASESEKKEKEAVAETTEKKKAEFKPTDFESWKSASGTNIEARLISVDDAGLFVFETRDGRKIPVSGEQLEEASLKRARKIAAGES